MKYRVIVVRDRAADVYGIPSVVASIGGAIRSFGDEVNRAADDNQFYKHPEDFDLYELGTYDDAEGRYECEGAPRQIAVGKDLKRSTNGA
jgi:hypothetical protein